MPRYNGGYPPSDKNQLPKLRKKEANIANEFFKESGDEGIATGLNSCADSIRESVPLSIKYKKLVTLNDEGN